MIILSRNNSFSWHTLGDCYFKGYSFSGVENDQLLEDFCQIDEEKDFIEFLRTVDGEFSFLKETEDYIFAGVDYGRSFPLFFTEHEDGLAISDQPQSLYYLLRSKEVDALAMRELRISGHTFGNRTMLKGIYTLGAGEMLFYDKSEKELRIREYMDFSYPWEEKSPEEMAEDLNRLYLNAIESSLADIKTSVLLEINGDWFSRLILGKLLELGYKDVIMYTYGGPDNKNAIYARRMAEYAGYPWHYIEYDGMEWYKWFNGRDYDQYADYSSCKVNVPRIREFLAVKRMKERGIAQEGDVFLNYHDIGHLTGQNLPKIFLDQNMIREESAKSEVLMEVASANAWDRKDTKLIDDYIEDIYSLNPDIESPSDFYNYGIWKEHLAKEEASKNRIFEYFNFEWRNVHMNLELIRYWWNMPSIYKYGGVVKNTFDQDHNDDFISGLGFSPYPTKRVSHLGFRDIMRIRFPGMSRRLDFIRRSRLLKDAYDEDPILWYNIISRRDFELLKSKITGITGVQAIMLLREEIKSHHFPY